MPASLSMHPQRSQHAGLRATIPATCTAQTLPTVNPAPSPSADPLVDWTGLVLAGGRSSRMGQDKAQLRWQGRSLLEHQIALLRAAGAREVWISGGQQRPDAMPDRWPDLGPLGGLASAAEALPDGWLLLLAVDMPRLDRAVLDQLLTVAGKRGACFRGHPMPCLLRLDDALRGELRGRLQAAPRERSLHALQAALDLQVIDPDPDTVQRLLNCNTPEEWRQQGGAL